MGRFLGQIVDLGCGRGTLAPQRLSHKLFTTPSAGHLAQGCGRGCVAMPRYGLIGDSSLYCKRGKRHKYVTEVLSQRLGKVDLIAYPGRGALRMKELLKEKQQKGEHYDVLGVSYFGASDL